ncbi:hypothetical protein [Paraburkholderia acidiphila]|uniref:Uncharacterized protein n=1 Tax=Paraburkholderia acidiphila TaxID=2571747 RepID=A0A7Z2GC46_9BURK|nr:hypothetical protein [Paraburkholderia acidiphila]QGZ59012.1 hypothetical protein FAZ97_29155 [Paraburkholderia acidiphila]
MTSQNEEAVNHLLSQLAESSDDCWDIYEEVGRVVVAQLKERDWRALHAIAKAWMISAAAQGQLADTSPESPDHALAAARAQDADGQLCALIARVVFGANEIRH